MARIATIVLFVGTLAAATAVGQTPAEAPAAAEVPAAAQPAEEAGDYDADALSEEGFRPAYGTGDADSIPGGQLMLAGYLVFFVLLTFYTTRLASRHAAVQSELAALRRLMEDIDDRLDGLDGGKRG